MSDEEEILDIEVSTAEHASEASESLEKHEYKNWVRGAKGLEFLQQGLAPFVDREIAAQHTIFRNKVPTIALGVAPCGCTIENVLPDHDVKKCKLVKCLCKKKIKNRRNCPNKYCSTFCQLVLSEHSFDEPLWNNTDIAFWPTDHWSVAKCFLTTICPSTSARDTDAAGLLSIIVNAKFFHHKVTITTRQANNVFCEARDMRNDILHKGKMELTDDELNNSIDTFKKVLMDPITLLHDPDAKTAVTRLEALKRGQIHVSMAEEEAILNRRIEAIKIRKQIEEERIKSLQEIETATSKAKDSLEVAKDDILKEIDESKEEIILEIRVVAAENKESIEGLKEMLKLTEDKVQKLEGQIRGRYIPTRDSDSLSASGSSAEEASDEDEEIDTKLKTDESVLQDVEDVDISLRDYQQELAAEGLKGRNVIIMAPTNTGKTRVACKIIQEHFRNRRKENKPAKVIFLVEKEVLALQQGKVFTTLLPAYRTKVISGSLQRDKKQFLKDLIEKRDVFVVTAQVLLNALKSKEIESVTKFSMLLFDECHHTDEQHPFNEIMGFYMNVKLDENSTPEQLPQVVGLTASLGVGGSTSKAAGMGHMKQLMANLDARCLCTVKEHKEQLRKYANKAKEHIVVAMKREKDTFRRAVLDVVQKIDDYMISHKFMSKLSSKDEFIKSSCRVPPSRGSESFQNWLSDFKENIANLRSDDTRKILFLCREHLEVYNKILMVYADARIKDALKVLSDFMETEKEKFQSKQQAYENPQDEGLETDTFLHDLFEEFKGKNFSDEEEANPKLLLLKDIILRDLCNNENTRGIVFVKTRNLALALANWMNETAELKGFNAKACIGQGGTEVKGLTKHLQRTVLKYFKKGRHRIVIATSVIEEGLDVTKCNLVVRYEHVTNEIVRLQSRGRARAKHSRYYVITEENSWIVDKEKQNAMLEDLMNDIVPELQKYVVESAKSWEQELNERQQARKLKKEFKEKQRSAKISGDLKKMHCQQCNELICLSSDVRKIQQSHHVIINEEAKQRLKIVRKPIAKFKDEDLQFDGDTLCGNTKCNYKLGGVCEYLGKEFPLIAIKSFRIVDKDGKGKVCKKWKDVNFEVVQLSLDELVKLGKSENNDNE